MSNYISVPTTTNYQDPKWDGMFAEKQSTEIDVQEFFNLMASQLANQDFMNPVDDSEYMNQLVQMNTLQAMQDMTNAMQGSYVANMLGKYAVLSDVSETGQLLREEGYITAVSLFTSPYEITVNGRSFPMSSLMELTYPAAEEGSGNVAGDGTENDEITNDGAQDEGTTDENP